MTLTIQQCMLVASRVTGVPQHIMRRPKRVRSISRARWLAWWLARRFTGSSYPHIAQTTGGWDHTSVLHGVRQFDAAYQHKEWAYQMVRSAYVEIFEERESL